MSADPADGSEFQAVVPLRSPEDVLSLACMGAAHQHRLSFMRLLLRRVRREGWEFARPVWNLDSDGYGTAVYQAKGPERTYSLVAFSHYLDPAQRVNKNLSTLWPSGTTADDVSNYLQEALDLVHAGGTPIAPGVPVTVRLSSGIDVQIGVRYDPITGRTIIGQFFPKAGPGLIQIPKADMQIINDMITP